MKQIRIRHKMHVPNLFPENACACSMPWFFFFFCWFCNIRWRNKDCKISWILLKLKLWYSLPPQTPNTSDVDQIKLPTRIRIIPNPFIFPPSLPCTIRCSPICMFLKVKKVLFMIWTRNYICIITLVKNYKIRWKPQKYLRLIKNNKIHAMID